MGENFMKGDFDRSASNGDPRNPKPATPAKSADNPALQPGSTFAILFLLCAVPVASLISRIPDAYLVAWRDLAMLVAKAVANVLGIATASNADILTVNGFAMRIIGQCTAVDYIAILATAMLLYTRHSIRYRLLGLAIAVPVIVVVNACRLIISGMVGSFSRRAFHIVHDYLWVIGFALVVFAIWTFWVNGRFFVSRSAARRLALVLLASITAYGLLVVFHDPYGQLLARTSSLVYETINNDSRVTILWQGGELVCSYAGTRFYVNNLLDQVNIVVFIGLMAPLQRKGDWRMLAMTILGLIAMVLMSSIFIALGCGHDMLSEEGRLDGFVRVGSLVQLALPMAYYWLMADDGGKIYNPALVRAGTPATASPGQHGVRKKLKRPCHPSS